MVAARKLHFASVDFFMFARQHGAWKSLADNFRSQACMCAGGSEVEVDASWHASFWVSWFGSVDERSARQDEGHFTRATCT